MDARRPARQLRAEENVLAASLPGAEPADAGWVPGQAESRPGYQLRGAPALPERIMRLRNPGPRGRAGSKRICLRQRWRLLLFIICSLHWHRLARVLFSNQSEDN